MEIVLASRNPKKIRELQAMLSEYLHDIKVLSLDDIGLTDDIVEDGESFEDNAYIKASAVAERGYIGVGDDSGLTVNALGGAPGIYSARYAGEHGNDAANNARLLRELANKDDRSAAFVCTIACKFPDGASFVCRGECCGEIIDEYRGEGGFGYDPLFYYPELGKTFAELSAEEKNRISHRGKAMKKFATEFLKRTAK